MKWHYRHRQASEIHTFCYLMSYSLPWRTHTYTVLLMLTDGISSSVSSLIWQIRNDIFGLDMFSHFHANQCIHIWMEEGVWECVWSCESVCKSVYLHTVIKLWFRLLLGSYVAVHRLMQMRTRLHKWMYIEKHDTRYEMINCMTHCLMNMNQWRNKIREIHKRWLLFLFIIYIFLKVDFNCICETMRTCHDIFYT